MRPRALFDKIWDDHVVTPLADAKALIHIDAHMLYEVTSPHAFAALAAAGRTVRNPELHYSTCDHIVSTAPGRTDDTEPSSAALIAAMRQNAQSFRIPHFALGDLRQGIVHVIAPELGVTLPGMTIVCGDSHTSTNGALGAWGWGIGISDVEHVLATQTLALSRPRTMRVWLDGVLTAGVSAKDLVLALIGHIGTAGANGYALELAGPAVTALDMDARFTLCNMGVEAGARGTLIAPDDRTISYVKGRPFAPKAAAFDAAVKYWRSLASDDGAEFDLQVDFDAGSVAPQITWGTSPEQVIDIGGCVPDPALEPDLNRRQAMTKALGYMGLEPGQSLVGLPVDVVFIGSCTNSRLSDLRAAAEFARGNRVRPGVRAVVVPGSGQVKRDAEAIGLDRIFKDAGFEWREPGCSMCVSLGQDRVGPRQRCVATTNRNFEGRQGPQARTHLVSPAVAAATAVSGVIADPRRLRR